MHDLRNARMHVKYAQTYAHMREKNKHLFLDIS